MSLRSSGSRWRHGTRAGVGTSRRSAARSLLARHRQREHQRRETLFAPEPLVGAAAGRPAARSASGPLSALLVDDTSAIAAQALVESESGGMTSRSTRLTLSPMITAMCASWCPYQPMRTRWLPDGVQSTGVGAHSPWFSSTPRIRPRRGARACRSGGSSVLRSVERGHHAPSTLFACTSRDAIFRRRAGTAESVDEVTTAGEMLTDMRPDFARLEARRVCSQFGIGR